MSKNINQIFTANPITSNQPTDLMYFGRSPYGTGDDAAMTYANFSNQLVTPQQVQQDTFNFGTCTGTTPKYDVVLSPTVTTLTNGLLVIFQPNFNSPANPTLSVNGLTAKNIVAANYSSGGVVTGQLFPRDLNTTTIAYAVYSLALDSFVLLNPNVTTVTGQTVQKNAMISGTDSGVVNAYIWTNAFYPSANLLTNGSTIVLTAIANSNTGASTLTVNGTTRNIVGTNGAPLAGGEMVSGGTYFLLANATQFILMNATVASGVLKNVTVNSNTYNMSPNTRYLTANTLAQVEYFLPASGVAAVGDIIKILGSSTNGWKITTTNLQQINLMGLVTNIAGGSLTPNQFWSSITLVCMNSTGLWYVDGSAPTMEIMSIV